MNGSTTKGRARRAPPRSSAHRAAPPIVHDATTCPCDPCRAIRAKTHEPCAIGYARVSTDEQKTRQQVDALEAAGCAQLYVDNGVSGATRSRPELDRCLDALRAGDTLVVWKLDRLGRSLSHLLGILEMLKARGIAFRSLTEGIDTSTPAGTMLYAILGVVAQFERDITTERINSSLAAKKVRGEPLGRRRVLTSTQVAKAREMVDGGESPAHVARILQVSRATLWRALVRGDAEQLAQGGVA
jgi:DNA invertase Pin-like site-specific DNA recombinase